MVLQPSYFVQTIVKDPEVLGTLGSQHTKMPGLLAHLYPLHTQTFEPSGTFGLLAQLHWTWISGTLQGWQNWGEAGRPVAPIQIFAKAIDKMI